MGLVNANVKPLGYLGHLLEEYIRKEKNQTSKENTKAIKVTLELRCDGNRENY